MKYIKLALISFIFFALLLTGISLLFPSHVRISKAIDINASKEQVLMQLKDTSNWKNWYPGADSLLPSVDLTFNDSLVKFQQIREGKKAEEGWNIIQTERPNITTVQWYMDIKLSWYPWEKFSSIMLENRYGPFMEKGLAGLKVYLEKQ